MIYEHRTYTCMPNKLPVVLKRFENTTLGLFEKHGIKRITPLLTMSVGESNMLVQYILAWESFDEREAKWAAFRADPAWQQALVESEAGGPSVAKITNELLAAAPFSVK